MYNAQQIKNRFNSAGVYVVNTRVSMICNSTLRCLYKDLYSVSLLIILIDDV